MKTTDDENAEADKVIAELDALIHQWGMRDADPSVACTMTLIRIAALTGQLFDDEAAHRHYLKMTLDTGVQYYNEMENGEKNYVH